MKEINVSSSRTKLWIFVAFLPSILFIWLRLNPRLDTQFAAPLFHFYVVTFAAFAALVVALFVASAVERARNLYVHFITMGFAAIAALFLLHGLATPGVIIQEFNQAVGWSARASLLSGAILFALGTVRWSDRRAGQLLARRWQLWLAAAVLYLGYAVVAFGFPQPLAVLSTMQPWLNLGLAAISTGLYLWASWSALRRGAREGVALWTAIGLALLLLAQAQLSMVLGPLWAMSWWLYHVLMLAGFLLAVMAISVEYEALADFRPTRYFSAIGALIAFGLALVSGELAVRLVGDPTARLPFLAITLIVTSTLFVALFFVVRRADALIRERSEALAREQKLRADFTRLVVHDLKNPLAAVIANLSALRSGMAGEIGNEQARFIGRAMNSADDIQSLLDDLLDYERLEGGVLTPKLQPIELGSMIEARTRVVHEQIRQNEQQLDVDLAAALPQVWLDPDLMQRVLDNLIGNAIKFSGRGGNIEVAAYPTEGGVQIDVLDDGPGVLAGDRQRIFDRFYRGGNVERRGAGLGLAFCRMVVQAHEGSIWVDDGARGGAAFHLKLPINEGAEPA